MQIEITKDVLTVYGKLSAGDTIQISDDEAKMLIELGAAKLREAGAPPVKRTTRRKVAK